MIMLVVAVVTMYFNPYGKQVQKLELYRNQLDVLPEIATLPDMDEFMVRPYPSLVLFPCFH